MFDTFINQVYLTFWSGEKKVGPHGEVLLSKKCESFGDMVYDLRWSLKYIHKDGKTSRTLTISERANKWDVKKNIKRVEKNILPRKIKELLEAHKDATCVK
ncbi:MAG: hypothetical protein J6W52_04230 [Bacteroidaceae bacterium]|nr:hypothetical protein [Bacteroidaceae bacterium]